MAARTFDLLEFVAGSDRPASLLEVAEQSGIDKSTSSRLLAFLVGRGYLERDPVSRRYWVGPSALALSGPALRRFGIQEIASPILEQLRDASGETATVHVCVGDDRLCTGGAESRHQLRRVVPLGERLPLHAGGSSGRIIAAFSGPPEAPERADAAWRKVVRAKGYFAGVDDRTEGAAGISAPLFGRQGIYGSITIAGPSERWTMAQMTAFAPELLRAARRITAALGGTFPEVPLLSAAAIGVATLATT